MHTLDAGWTELNVMSERKIIYTAKTYVESFMHGL